MPIEDCRRVSPLIAVLAARLMAIGDTGAQSFVQGLLDDARAEERGEDVDRDLGFDLFWLAERFQLRGDRAGAVMARILASKANAFCAARAGRRGQRNFPGTPLADPSPAATVEPPVAQERALRSRHADEGLVLEDGRLV